MDSYKIITLNLLTLLCFLYDAASSSEMPSWGAYKTSTYGVLLKHRVRLSAELFYDAYETLPCGAVI